MLLTFKWRFSAYEECVFSAGLESHCPSLVLQFSKEEMLHLLGMLDVPCLFMATRKACKEGYLLIDFYFFKDFFFLDTERQRI